MDDARDLIQIFWIFLRLGLTSFGGPVAHLSYFHDEFVTRRKWFDEHAYADLVALCQFLPGPASSQVGIAIGLARAGLPGAVAAWCGFTLPSAVLMVAFAYGVASYGSVLGTGWLHGLKVVAVAIVAQALWAMGTRLCPDRTRASLAGASAVGALLLPTTTLQIGLILLGGLLGALVIRDVPQARVSAVKIKVGKTGSAFALATFIALLVALPMLARASGDPALALFDSFFRAGSLVFGGGHVVLPLLKAEVVEPGWVTANAFMAGYGAAQAVPGPLFTFSAYLGAVAHGWWGACVSLVGAFLPSFLLVTGALPVWDRVRSAAHMRRALLGVNAAVVGLLLAAFYDPVWTSAIVASKDFALALACFSLLVFWKVPSTGVVLFGALAGGLWL